MLSTVLCFGNVNLIKGEVMKSAICLVLGVSTFFAHAQNTPHTEGKMLDLNVRMPVETRSIPMSTYGTAKEISNDEVKLIKKINYSIGIGGWSHHDTSNKSNKFNQKNPYLEIDIWLDYNILGGRPFIGYGHVFNNSRNGTTDILFIANQWKLISGRYIDLCGGVGAARARYTVANVPASLPNSITGNTPFGYLCLEKQNFAVRFVPLGKNATFVYLVYSF